MDELGFMYFPGDYRWSHGMLLALGAAPWGGAEIGEVHRVGLALKDKIGDDEAWFSAWAASGKQTRDLISRELSKLTAPSRHSWCQRSTQRRATLRQPSSKAATSAAFSSLCSGIVSSSCWRGSGRLSMTVRCYVRGSVRESEFRPRGLYWASSQVIHSLHLLFADRVPVGTAGLEA